MTNCIWLLAIIVVANARSLHVSHGSSGGLPAPHPYHAQPYSYPPLTPYGHYGYQSHPLIYSPPGTYFDSVYGVRKPVPGGGYPVAVDYSNRCSSNYVGIKAHPDEHQYYYVCRPNCVIFCKCPYLEKFSPVTGHCVQYVRPDYPPICQKDGRFPCQHDCKNYYKCDKGQRPRLYSCPTGTLFSLIESKCVPGNKCPSTEILYDDSYTPENYELNFPECTEEGTFRSPKDCSLYYTCKIQSNGNYLQTRLKCPAKNSFDPECKLCRPHHEVECQAYVSSDNLAYVQMPPYYPYVSKAYYDKDTEAEEQGQSEAEPLKSVAPISSTTDKYPSYPPYAYYYPSHPNYDYDNQNGKLESESYVKENLEKECAHEVITTSAPTYRPTTQKPTTTPTTTSASTTRPTTTPTTPIPTTQRPTYASSTYASTARPITIPTTAAPSTQKPTPVPTTTISTTQTPKYELSTQRPTTSQTTTYASTTSPITIPTTAAPTTQGHTTALSTQRPTTIPTTTSQRTYPTIDTSTTDPSTQRPTTYPITTLASTAKPITTPTTQRPTTTLTTHRPITASTTTTITTKRPTTAPTTTTITTSRPTTIKAYKTTTQRQTITSTPTTNPTLATTTQVTTTTGSATDPGQYTTTTLPPYATEDTNTQLPCILQQQPQPQHQQQLNYHNTEQIATNIFIEDRLLSESKPQSLVLSQRLGSSEIYFDYMNDEPAPEKDAESEPKAPSRMSSLAATEAPTPRVTFAQHTSQPFMDKSLHEHTLDSKPQNATEDTEETAYYDNEYDSEEMENVIDSNSKLINATISVTSSKMAPIISTTTKKIPIESTTTTNRLVASATKTADITDLLETTSSMPVPAIVNAKTITMTNMTSDLEYSDNYVDSDYANDEPAADKELTKIPDLNALRNSLVHMLKQRLILADTSPVPLSTSSTDNNNFKDPDYANDEPIVEVPGTTPDLSALKNTLINMLKQKLRSISATTPQTTTQSSVSNSKDLALEPIAANKIESIQAKDSKSLLINMLKQKLTRIAPVKKATELMATNTTLAPITNVPSTTAKTTKTTASSSANGSSNSEYYDDEDYDYANDEASTGTEATINQDALSSPARISATVKRHSVHPSQSLTALKPSQFKTPSVSSFVLPVGIGLTSEVKMPPIDERKAFKAGILAQPLPKILRQSGNEVGEGLQHQSNIEQDTKSTKHRQIRTINTLKEKQMQKLLQQQHNITAIPKTTTNIKTTQVATAATRQEILMVNKKPWLLQTQQQTIHLAPIQVFPVNNTNTNRSLLEPTTVDYQTEKVPKLILKVYEPIDVKVIFCPRSCDQDHDHKYDPVDNFKPTNCTSGCDTPNPKTHHSVDLWWKPLKLSDTAGFQTIA